MIILKFLLDVHSRFRSWPCYVYGKQLSQFIEFGTQTCTPFSYEHGKVWPFDLQFLLTISPLVTNKGHEKKGNDQQHEKLLIFKPILLVSTFGYMSCKRQTWKLLAKFFKIWKLCCSPIIKITYSWYCDDQELN